MKELKLVTKEIKCDANGKGWVTISGLARLAGVKQQSVSEWFSKLTHRQKYDSSLESKGLPTGKNEIYILDVDAGKYISKQAMAGNKKALLSLTQFATVGLRTMIQIESGFNRKLTTDELLELKQAREKLAYCSIHEDAPKAVFKERNNNKVSDIKQAWIANKWMIPTPRTVTVFDDTVTIDGSKYLYIENGKVRVHREQKRDVLMITHGTLIGMNGQSDLIEFLD